ncbi:MAG: signal peptidase II [Myxococcota bacterium]
MTRARRIATRLAWFVGTTVLSGGCDLGTKHWAERTLTDAPGHTMALIHPWLDASLTYNRGTAFSFIGDLGDARLWLGLLSLAAVIAMAVLATRSDSDTGDTLALGAIAGGAIGNGVDRVLRTGATGQPAGVVDFIKVNYPWGGSWPSFNIADALIGVGVAIMLLRRLRKPEPPAEAATAA